MKNIVKAQFYQIVRDKIIKYIVVVTLLMQVLIVLLPVWLGTMETTTAGEFFATDGSATHMFSMFFLILVTAQICGADFLDKTHHYELMIGHRRHEVYLGRVIAAAIVGAVGALFFTILPIGIYGALYGWGEKVTFAPVLLRWFLMLLVYLRMVCEFSFLTFLTKNPYVVMGFGYIVFMVGGILASGTNLSLNSVFLGSTNLSLLSMVSKWATYGLGGDMNYIFEANLGVGTVLGTVAASVGIGAAAVYLGYVFFKNDDMN